MRVRTGRGWFTMRIQRLGTVAGGRGDRGMDMGMDMDMNMRKAGHGEMQAGTIGGLGRMRVRGGRGRGGLMMRPEMGG